MAAACAHTDVDEEFPQESVVGTPLSTKDSTRSVKTQAFVKGRSLSNYHPFRCYVSLIYVCIYSSFCFSVSSPSSNNTRIASLKTSNLF